MPPNWSTPGLWDLPTSPKGQPYGGLPVVDGRVVARPFLEALDAGACDDWVCLNMRAVVPWAPLAL